MPHDRSMPGALHGAGALDGNGQQLRAAWLAAHQQQQAAQQAYRLAERAYRTSLSSKRRADPDRRVVLQAAYQVAQETLRATRDLEARTARDYRGYYRGRVARGTSASATASPRDTSLRVSDRDTRSHRHRRATAAE